MLKIAFQGLILLLVGCGTAAKRLPAQVTPPTDGQRATAKIPADQYLDAQKFNALLVGNPQFQTIEDVLPFLAQKYPDYLRFNLLVYASLSLHESSYEQPRVIVFGPDSRFLISFNGNAHQRGGSEIETLQYNLTTHAFEFRQIRFKKGNLDDDPTGGLDPKEVDINNSRVMISKPNPQRCLQCHGQTANPIFATYFTWPGFYGSNDDNLYFQFVKSKWNPNNEAFFSSLKKPASLGRLMLVSDKDDTELAGMLRYLKGKYTHPRYKYLPKAFIEDPLTAYQAGKLMPDLDYSDAAKKEMDKYQVYGEWPFRPNDFYQNQLVWLNQDRVIHRLQDAGLQKNAYAQVDWATLGKAEENAKSAADPIGFVATQIQRTLATIKLKKGTPTVAQVRAALETNIRDEYSVLRDKLSRQNDNFEGKMKLFWYPNEGDAPFYKPASEWLGPSNVIYPKLLKMKSQTEVDRIALNYEGDNQIGMTILQLLLADNGVDLHDFSLNLSQQGLTFHEEGMTLVLRWLGIPLWG